MFNGFKPAGASAGVVFQPNASGQAARTAHDSRVVAAAMPGTTPGTVTLPGYVFRAMLTAGLAAASKDATLPTLCGVRIVADGAGLTTWATDRYRLSRAVWAGVTGDGDALLHRDDVATLVKALPAKPAKVDGCDWAELSYGDRELTVTAGTLPGRPEWSRTMATLDGQFPPVASLLADAETRAASASDGPVSYSFDPRFLSDGLKLAPKGARAELCATQADKPFLLTFHGGDSVDGLTVTYMQMPLRVPAR